MNSPMWVSWIVVAVLAVLSIILLTGRGSFLVAGYNMMSKEQKQKYNKKRLCRIMGGGAGVIAVILGIATAYHFEMPAAIGWIIPLGLFGAVIAIMLLANTVCKRKPSSPDQ